MAGSSTNESGVLQGTSIRLSAQSFCVPEGDVTWWHYNQMSGVNSTVDIDLMNVFLTHENDLIILNASSAHSGTYQLEYGGTVLTEVTVSVTGRNVNI